MASGPHVRCMQIVTYATEPGDTGRLGMARCDKTLHNPRGVHAMQIAGEIWNPLNAALASTPLIGRAAH